MARLRRQWGTQSRWRPHPAAGVANPWWQPDWCPDEGSARSRLEDVNTSPSLEARLVSRVVGDVEVVEP